MFGGKVVAAGMTLMVLLVPSACSGEREQAVPAGRCFGGRGHGSFAGSQPFRHGIPDGLPPAGATSLQNVQTVLASLQPRLTRECPGVVSVAVERRNGDVWERIGRELVVRADRGYQLVVRVTDERYAPDRRVFVDGPAGRVPVRFTKA